MDKNYYLNQKIEEDGVARTLNPSYIRENYKPLTPNIPTYNVGQYFDDNSKYDEKMGSSVFDIVDGTTTINDMRADIQGGLDRFGNALVNNLVIAGTTAISNSLGLANGLFSALINWDASKIWDNATNNYMASLQDRAREAMPIYRGSDYENKSLWGKLGSSVFWADLVQNLGYTEGMFLPGAGVSKLVSGASKAVKMLVPSLVASIGEASIEAVQAKNDEVQNKSEIAKQRYIQLMQQAPDEQTRRSLEEAYKATLQSINDDATTAGNIVFGSNVALLTATNTIEFGNLWSRGFNTQRKLRGAIRRSGDAITGGSLIPEGYEVGKKAAITELVGRKLIESGSEGMEEVSQDIIQNTPKNYSKANTFNESIFNPEKREIASGLMGAMGQGIAETLRDNNTATDFAMGFITGAIGVPSLKKGGFPLTLQNNMIADIIQGVRSLNEQQTAVDEANRRLQNSPAIKEYYNGLVRHMSIQEDMNRDVDNNDKAGYKEKESAQFIGDIITFDNVGDLNRLEEIIENSVDTSDEGIQELIQSTSKNGNGPFITDGNPMSVEEVRDIIEEKKNKLISKIQGYKRNKDIINSTYPNISKEALEDALYLKGQIDDIDERIGELSSSIDNRVSAFENLNVYKYGKGDTNLRAIRDDSGQISSYTTDASKSNELLTPKDAKELAQNLFLAGKPLEAKKVLEQAFKSMPINESDNLITEVQDLSKLKKSYGEYNKSFAETLKKPEKATEDRNKLQEQAIKKDKERKKSALEQELDNAKTVHDIPSIISKSDNPEEAANTVVTSQNPIAREYTRINNLDKSVREAYNKYAENQQELAVADALWKDHIDNSDTYKDASNFDINTFPTKEEAEKILGTPIDDNLYNKALGLLSRATTDYRGNEDVANKFSREAKPTTYDNSIDYADEDGNPLASEEESNRLMEQKKNRTPEEKLADDFQELQERESSTDQPAEDDDTSVVTANNTANSIKDNLPEAIQGQKQYIQTDTPEVGRDAITTKDWSTFDIRFPQYAPVFNYLKERGAFDYVNKGKLKAGDTIRFMIDPTFGEDAIFMITEEGQVIGNIDPNKKSLGNFLGLSQLVDKIKEEYQNREDKESKEIFIASMQTHVSQILRGKIPVGEETQSNSLNNIPGVMVEKLGTDGNPILDDKGNPIRDLSKDVRFGVMKNGTIITNSGEPISVIAPADTEYKEGRTYILIKNSTGEYNAMAVRVKHFNASEFDIRYPNSSESETPIGKTIRNAIEKFVTGKPSVNTLVDAYRTLNRFLYLRNIRFIPTTDGSSSYRMDIINTEVGTIASIPIVENGNLLDKDTIVEAIINTLYSVNAPMQVSIRNTDNNLFKSIIASNILSSNILQAKPVSGWFTVNPIDTNGEEIMAKPMQVPKPVVNSQNNPIGGKESVNNGIKVDFNRRIFYVDIDKKIVRDSEGKESRIDDNNILLATAVTQQMYGDATEGANMVNNKVLLPDGRVFDRTSQKFLTGEEAQKVIDALNPKPSIVDEVDTNTDEVIEDSIDESDDLWLKESTKSEYTLWNQEKELTWLNKVLPNLSRDARVKITNGLIKVANSGATAWGMVNDGIMTLSDIAAEGTTYHEAFHVVFNYLLNEEEQGSLYREAKEKWGDISNKDLQENMAEAFREYVINRESSNLGRRILNFFQDLLVKVMNWGKIKPSMNAYFRMITEGKYANTPMSENTNVDYLLRNTDIPIIRQRLEKASENLDRHYEDIKKAVRRLNFATYNYEDHAYKAYVNAGLDMDFYKGLTRFNPNGGKGYKIRILTKENYKWYKRDKMAEAKALIKMDLVKQKQALEKEGITFDRLDGDIQMELINKGVTKENFDKISREEREQMIKCIHL